MRSGWALDAGRRLPGTVRRSLERRKLDAREPHAPVRRSHERAERRLVSHRDGVRRGWIIQRRGHHGGDPHLDRDGASCGDLLRAHTTAPEQTAPPTITGTLEAGQILQEQHASWTHGTTERRYQWERCNMDASACVPIGLATQLTYVLQADDVNHRIEVSETATNDGGSGAPAISAPTATINPAPPVGEAPPTLSGEAAIGQTLTESHGTWSSNPSSYTYQWEDCDPRAAQCAPIPDATAQSYVVRTSDSGHRIRVTETASNASGVSAPAPSQATAVVPPAAGDTGSSVNSPASPARTSPPPSASAPSPQRSGPAAGGAPAAGAAATRSQVRALLRGTLGRRPRSLSWILRHGGYTLEIKARISGRITIAWYARRAAQRRPVCVVLGSSWIFPRSSAHVRLLLTPLGRSLLSHATRASILYVVRLARPGSRPVRVARRIVITK